MYCVNKTIWYVIYFLFHDNDEKKAVILKFYHMPNCLISIIHSKIPPHFKECWGKIKKCLKFC